MNKVIFGYEVPDSDEDLSLAEVFMDDDDLVATFFKVMGDLNQDLNAGAR